MCIYGRGKHDRFTALKYIMVSDGYADHVPILLVRRNYSGFISGRVYMTGTPAGERLIYPHAVLPMPATSNSQPSYHDRKYIYLIARTRANSHNVLEIDPCARYTHDPLGHVQAVDMLKTKYPDVDFEILMFEEYNFPLPLAKKEKWWLIKHLDFQQIILLALASAVALLLILSLR
jgi:hypothetical protein